MGTYTAKTRNIGKRPRSKRLRELGGSVTVIGGGSTGSGGSYAPLVHSHEMEDVAGLESSMANFSQQLSEKASTSYVTGQIANIFGALQAFQLIRNLVTAISSESTDDQYPSAKLLYEKLAALANVYAAISHTHIASEISDLATTLANYVTLATAQTISGKKTLSAGVVNNSAYFQSIVTATLSSATYTIANLKAHTLTLAANVTITLPTVSDGAATLRLKLIQDATGGRSVTFAAASGIKIYNPNETDLSEGAANELCWVTLLWDGACWVWQATPYVSPN